MKGKVVDLETYNEYTQIITPTEALFEYCQNEELQKCLESEKIIYIEGAFVLKTPHTVYNNDGKFMLTEYARENLRSCALSFGIQLTYKTEKLFGKKDTFGRGKIEKHKCFDLSETKRQIEASNLTKEIKQGWLAEVDEFVFHEMQDQTCWKMIGKKLAEKHANPNDFTEKTLLPERYYYRAKNDEHEQAPGIRTIMAIAAGYSFDLPFTKKLLELAGYSFSRANPEHVAYKFILKFMSGSTLFEKNELLKRSGFKPLGIDES